MHNTIDIVEEFENSLSNFRNDTINKYSKAFRIFDDVKNESEASNYGKLICSKKSFINVVKQKTLEQLFYVIITLITRMR